MLGKIPVLVLEMKNFGTLALMRRSLIQIVRRPLYWYAILVIPVFFILFLPELMEDGLPTRVPATVIDLDNSSISRSLMRNLDGMQMVSIEKDCVSFTDARKAMQKGKIYGFFLIPENFQQDILSGRNPIITFYTNMTYYVPASLLFKAFKTTALITKAGVAIKLLESAGVNEVQVMPMLQPVNISVRGIGNPELNYGIYLANSFVPGILQLMILLVTCYSICEEIKRSTSRRWIDMAGGSVVKALFGKLLPQTLIWIVVALFMESWLFCYNGYPMHGSWLWLTLSEVLFVIAVQSLAVFYCAVFPNLRLSLSVSALTGVLTFSIAAYSFPVESMYPAMGIFSWIMPARYNFLIYVDQALNGAPICYSCIWFVAYICYFILPFTMLWRLKPAIKNPVYIP